MNIHDKYRSLSELSASEVEGRDYRRIVVPRLSSFVITAPHGGGIEPGTSEIASAIAGYDFSLYCFEGLKEDASFSLHITSTRMDEPQGLHLISKTETAVTIHGVKGAQAIVWVGGRHLELRRKVIENLRQAGFQAREDRSDHSGSHPVNICNRCKSGKGLQLEISTGLRREMFAGFRRLERQSRTSVFRRFVLSLRQVLQEAG